MLTKLRTHAITAALALATMCGAIANADVSFAGASQVAAGASAQYHARGLAANAAVTVVIRTPDGAETADSAMTDASGNLDYSITPSAHGTYTLSIMTSDGQVVATASFIAR